MGIMAVRWYLTRKLYGNIRSLQNVLRNIYSSITHCLECTVYRAQKIVNSP